MSCKMTAGARGQGGQIWMNWRSVHGAWCQEIDEKGVREEYC